MEISVELQRYMGSNAIRGEVKSQALQMMEDLLGAGFHTIDAFPMWLSYDSAKVAIGVWPVPSPNWSTILWKRELPTSW